MTCVYDERARVGDSQRGPEPFGQWYGPGGFKLLSWEVDFRAGGAARLCVRSPEGRDHLVEGIHLEIVEPERVVFRGDLGFAGATITFRRA